MRAQQELIWADAVSDSVSVLLSVMAHVLPSVMAHREALPVEMASVMVDLVGACAVAPERFR